MYKIEKPIKEKVERKIVCPECKERIKVTDEVYYIEDGIVYYTCPKCLEEFTKHTKNKK